MSEKSKLMADAWRDLPTGEKDKYCVQEEEALMVMKEEKSHLTNLLFALQSDIRVM